MADQIKAWRATDGSLHDNEVSAARADFRHLILNIAGEFDPAQEYVFDPLIERMWRSRQDIYSFLLNLFELKPEEK